MKEKGRRKLQSKSLSSQSESGSETERGRRGLVWYGDLIGVWLV